jgi:hypothetical protein
VEVIPFTAEGTPRRAPDAQVLARSDQTAQQATASVQGAQTAPIGAASQPKKSTIAGLSNDFKSAKEAAIEMMMAKYGLEVLGDGFTIDDKGIAHGRVKDVNGQILLVEANTTPGANDPQKNNLRFKFTYADDKSKSFNLNQDDLSQFEPKAGERKPAEFVAFGKKPTIFRGEKTSIIPRIGLPTTTVTLTAKAEEDRMKAATSGRIGAAGQPGEKPTALAKTMGEPIVTTTQIRPAKTVMQKKRDLQKQRYSEESQAMPQFMGGESAFAGAGEEEQGQQVAPKRRKSKMPWVAGIATGGTVVAGVGGSMWVGSSAAAAEISSNYIKMFAGSVNFILKLTHFFS